MFEPQRALPVRLEIPPRVVGRADESLADYAKRIAASLDTREPFHLGGASFGGMLALEVARHVRPRSLVLISSCRSRCAVPLFARMAGTFTPLLPARSFSLMKRSAALARRAFGISSHAHARLFSDMLRDTPPEHLKWCVHAVLNWDGAAALSVPSYHVHGEIDHVLPLKGVKADHVVRGAGHLANLTHPREVNDAITAFLTSVDG
jgi:pimeloyl-ACP methyl ester carboxylesterase